VPEETADLREAFEERAGILQYDAGLPRPDAELEAARITATYARNRGVPVGVPCGGACALPRAAVPGTRQARHSGRPWAWPSSSCFGIRVRICHNYALFISMMLAGWTAAHLALLRAVEIVIASGLRILGVSAPQEMR
jgi:hypothetical protein